MIKMFHSNYLGWRGGGSSERENEGETGKRHISEGGDAEG